MGQLFSKAIQYFFEELDSTNIYAAKLLADAEEGTVVVAKFQTKGRGQGKNSWESAFGQNLTFSVVLHPEFLKVIDQFYLSKAISLAVADFVALFVPNISIKWPNDIYVGNKKIAGILIENSIERDYIKTSIIGIGININQTAFSPVLPNPVSISMITNEVYEIEEMLGVFMKKLENRYRMLKNGNFKTIDKLYLKIIFQKGVPARYMSNGIKFTGIITGVEATGELLITDESGKTRKFLHKEVEFVIN